MFCSSTLSLTIFHFKTVKIQKTNPFLTTHNRVFRQHRIFCMATATTCGFVYVNNLMLFHTTFLTCSAVFMVIILNEAVLSRQQITSQFP